ncbi:hypothetical protein AusDCA_2856 [Desulfitobacterium sp. AusDCA]
MLDLSQPTPSGMSDLEHCRRLSMELNRLRIDSAKAGIDTIEYIGIDGQIHHEYYHGLRWNDRPATCGEYRSHSI